MWTRRARVCVCVYSFPHQRYPNTAVGTTCTLGGSWLARTLWSLPSTAGPTPERARLPATAAATAAAAATTCAPLPPNRVRPAFLLYDMRGERARASVGRRPVDLTAAADCCRDRCVRTRVQIVYFVFKLFSSSTHEYTRTVPHPAIRRAKRVRSNKDRPHGQYNNRIGRSPSRTSFDVARPTVSPRRTVTFATIQQ